MFWEDYTQKRDPVGSRLALRIAIFEPHLKRLPRHKLTIVVTCLSRNDGPPHKNHAEEDRRETKMSRVVISKSVLVHLIPPNNKNQPVFNQKSILYAIVITCTYHISQLLFQNMKILIATPIYPPEIGGPATYTKELVEHWRDAHDLTVVALTNNTQPVPGSTLIPISKQLPLPLRLWQFFIAVYKAAPEADVLYVQNAMAAGLPTVIAGMLRRKPVVLKFVGDEAWERATQHRKTDKRLQEFLEEPDAGFKNKLMMFVQGWVLRRATIVTTPSRYLGKTIEKAYGLHTDRVRTNYNAAEPTTAAPFSPEKKPYQLVATARLVSWKGIDGILRAIALLREKYPEVNLVVHGDGPERQHLEQLAQDLKISDAVTFTGNVARTETWHTRKASAAYILNSTYEGLPHTALTCFAAETPIIATNIPGTDEAVYHEKSGLLIPPDNPEALTAAVERIFNEPELGPKLVEGGTKILHEKFSWEVHLATLQNLLESAERKD